MLRKLFFIKIVIWSVVLIDGCTSDDCSKDASEIASMIKQNIDSTTNPCDNFYQFVCGNSNISTPAEKAAFEENPVYKRVEDLIKKGTGSKDFLPFQLIDDVYRTCMSDEAIGDQVVQELPHHFERLGGWPLLEGTRWMTSDFMWIDFPISSKIVGSGVNPFLDFQPVIHPERDHLSVKFIVAIESSEFQRSVSNSSDPLVIAYTKYIEKACALIGCQQTYPDEIKDIVELERKLSEIHLRNGRVFILSEFTYKELTEKFPSVFWFKFLNYAVKHYRNDLKISEMEFLVPPILGDVIDLLDSTPPRVLANYAGWKVLQNAIPFLTEEYRELKREFCLIQECDELERPVFCNQVVQRSLAPAVNLLYAKHYFSNETDAVVSGMVANIKNQIKDLISKSSWMDQDTKKESIDIVDGTSVLIGYAEKNKTDDDFVQFYEELEIDTSNFFRTLLNLEAFNAARRMYNTTSLGARNLVNPVTVFHPTYSERRIDIPMAMLQKPFFDVNYPMYINYGLTGKAIAEELVTDIVEFGRKRGDDQKLSCFKSQFEKITSDNSNLKHQVDSYRASSLIGEHIAYRASYQAYQWWYSSSGSEPMLPQLPYSNNQMFWISSLQNLCAHLPKDIKVIDDKYSFVEFRTMKAVTSVPGFNNDFYCQNAGSFAMNYGPSCSYF